MYATLAIITLAASVVSAGVLPRANAGTALVLVDDEVHAEAITHAFFCQNAPWTNPCTNDALNTGQCYNFINGYDNAVSSFGPDAGTTCTLYDNSNCGGASFSISNPGIADLTSVGWNDRASSVRCN